MVDIIYKTVKPSHLKKLQILFQAIFIFSDWILIKQIIIPSTPVYCWGKQIFEKMWYERMSNSLLPRAWSQELGREVWVGRSLSKNYSNQCIFYVYELHKSENFSHMLEYKSLREISTSILERDNVPVIL